MQNFKFSVLASMLLIAMLSLSTSAIQAQQFITVWKFSDATSLVWFNAQTEGGAVNYTWATPTQNGSGNFTRTSPGSVTINVNVTAGQTLTLSMDPENLRRFYIDGGPNRSNLVEVSQWGNVHWTSMNGAFNGCNNLSNIPPAAPNLSKVTDLGSMFQGASIFNKPIGNWDVSNVTNMGFMFQGASSFNQDLNTWNTSNVTNMNSMFNGASMFDKPIGNWNTANVTQMSSMFRYANNFNQLIDSWNTSNVVNMSSMFRNTDKFDLAIGSWNTSAVGNMSFMFADAKKFNKPINNWNTANVTNMRNMFVNATSFNQPIGNWNTSMVTNMSNMFNGAVSFNQNLGTWNLGSITAPGLVDMLSNSGQDCGNYSATLKGWHANNPMVTGLVLGASGRQYGTQAVKARDALINTQGWTISGDTPINIACNIPVPCEGCGNDGLPFSSTTDNSNNSYSEQIGIENSTLSKDLEDDVPSQQTIKVYPNPTSSTATLHVVLEGVELSSQATLRIRDLQGGLIHQQAMSQQNDLQLSSLSPGIYLLEATDGITVWRERVAVVR